MCKYYFKNQAKKQFAQFGCLILFFSAILSYITYINCIEMQWCSFDNCFLYVKYENKS